MNRPHRRFLKYLAPGLTVASSDVMSQWERIVKIRIIDYRPPKIAQAFLLIAALLHWATPLAGFHIYSNHALAIVLGGAGFTVMMWGWGLFKKHRVSLCPTADTERLIDDGIYRYTRNPMYLGIVTMLLAVAIFVGSLVFYLAFAGYFVVIDAVFCRYEENKLLESFGDRYRRYRKRVRRWL